MEVFELKKPDTPKNVRKLIDVFLTNRVSILEYVETTNTPEYLFWDKIKHKPRPEVFTAEEYWALIKVLRTASSGRVKTAVSDKKGDRFTYQPIPGMDYFLHEVDMQLGGALESGIVKDQTMRTRFIARGIMEEAIASSQLEGANTTRKVAKGLLLEKRRPVSQSEKMIVNNYQAMMDVEERIRHEDLSLNTLLDLHVTLTRDTIDADDVGRLRRDKDEVRVVDAASNRIYHIPPPEKVLKSEIKKLIEYANDNSQKHQFVHPLIKAIILHFWVGYLHPFTDGNGRLARTIFYWYLLKQGYWAFAYLPLSRVIKNSPAQYRDAYVYSEQDDNDLTYFVDYNIRKIRQAMREFKDYVKRKQTENSRMTETARSKYALNDRQIQLLRHLHKNAGATTSIKTHAQIYSVSHPTARKDLEGLETVGFLSSKKVGRERPFRATSKTSELFT